MSVRRGAEVLRAVVELDDCTPREIIAKLRSYGIVIQGDGRTIGARLRRLTQAKLIEREPTRRVVFYKPTPRGREVDRIIAETTVSRGGTFQPLVNHIKDVRERMALQ